LPTPVPDDPPSQARLQSERAARLLDLLGLTEDELCAALAVDPLTLLSGQLDHRPELSILQDLLADAEERAGAPVLRRWVRAAGPAGRPIDALTRRDFTTFEDALTDLADRGFVLRGGGGAPGRGGSAGARPAKGGPAGDGSAGDGSAGEDPAGDGPAGDGPAGDGTAGDGTAGDGSAGEDPAGESLGGGGHA